MQKNFIIKSLLASLLVSIFMACAKDDKVVSQDRKETISFTSNIVSNSFFRVQDNQFEVGDAIGIYMMKANDTFDMSVSPKNAKYITELGGVTANFKPANLENTLKFNATVTSADFIAYYPYNESPIDGKVTLNTANQSNLAAIDLLYSNNLRGINKDNIPFRLKFKYKLPLLIFKFQDKNETAINANDIKNLTIRELLPEVQMNIANGELSTRGTATSIIANQNGKAIIPPQNVVDMKVTFSYKGKNYTWALGNKTFEEGKRYNFTAKLLEERVDPVDNSDGQIDDRDDGGDTGGVDLNPDEDNNTPSDEVSLSLANGSVDPINAVATTGEILLETNAKQLTAQVTEGADWLTASVDIDNKKILYSVSENISGAERVGKILVTASGVATASTIIRSQKSKTLEIVITQKAKDNSNESDVESNVVIATVAEGKSFEKYLVIENRGNEPVNLQEKQYAVNLYQYSNKGNLSGPKTLALVGTLEPGKALAIINSRAAHQELRNIVAINIIDDAIANFNGDDPLTLTIEGKAVDAFLPTPKGDNDVAPHKSEFEDRVFIRRSDIKKGNPTFNKDDWSETPAKVKDMGTISVFSDLYL